MQQPEYAQASNYSHLQGGKSAAPGSGGWTGGEYSQLQSVNRVGGTGRALPQAQNQYAQAQGHKTYVQQPQYASANGDEAAMYQTAQRGTARQTRWVWRDRETEKGGKGKRQSSRMC